MNRRHFLQQTGVTLLTGALGFHRPSSAGPLTSEKDIRWLEHTSSPIRILQFTDIHFFIRYTGEWAQAVVDNTATADSMRQLVDRTDPHLIMVTGDFWHDNPDGKGLDFLAYGIDVMAGLNCPWLFTWGNHDLVDDADRAARMLAEAPNSLYGGTDSGGHYLVRIGRKDQPWLDLFCLNSGKQGLKQPARDWIEGVVQRLSGQQREMPTRLAVFHIPLRQYREAWEHPSARGFKGEGVSYYQEDGQNLASFVQHGIRAAICGHNHTNDYEGITENISLIYGRATGLNGYGADVLPKGAKLYEYNPDTQRLSWKTVLMNGTIWEPIPGEKSS